MDYDADRLSPVLAGVALIGMGALLRHLRPTALDLPRPSEALRRPDPRDPADVAGRARDGIATAMPENLADSMGRSLMLMGAGLVALRALDELADGHDGLR